MEQNKTRFYLIRHGETDWNKGGRYQGCTNIQLNDAGREQARLLGERFKFLPLDVVYVSLWTGRWQLRHRWRRRMD